MFPQVIPTNSQHSMSGNTSVTPLRRVSQDPLTMTLTAATALRTAPTPPSTLAHLFPTPTHLTMTEVTTVPTAPLLRPLSLIRLREIPLSKWVLLPSMFRPPQQGRPTPSTTKKRVPGTDMPQTATILRVPSLHLWGLTSGYVSCEYFLFWIQVV